MLYAVKVGIFTQIIWNSAQEIFSPIIYFSDSLFISPWTHGYLVYALGYHPILFYFVV